MREYTSVQKRTSSVDARIFFFKFFWKNINFSWNYLLICDIKEKNKTFLVKIKFEWEKCLEQISFFLHVTFISSEFSEFLFYFLNILIILHI